MAGTLVGIAITYVAFFWIVKSTNFLNKIEGDISVCSFPEFKKAQPEHFVLFLRGFERDEYKENNLKIEFSEGKLAKVIEKGRGIQMYAVGMSKEVDTPIGGPRIYLEDETWEDNVLELMQAADQIIFLINDRNSCIWELKKAKELYSKCVFIVEELSKYYNAKEKLNDTIDFPTIPINDNEAIEYNPNRYYFSSDNEIKEFDGELTDYCQIAGISPETIKESDIEKKEKDFYSHPVYIITLCINILSLLQNLWS